MGSYIFILIWNWAFMVTYIILQGLLSLTQTRKWHRAKMLKFRQKNKMIKGKLHKNIIIGIDYSATKYVKFLTSRTVCPALSSSSSFKNAWEFFFQWNVGNVGEPRDGGYWMKLQKYAEALKDLQKGGSFYYKEYCFISCKTDTSGWVLPSIIPVSMLATWWRIQKWIFFFFLECILTC